MLIRFVFSTVLLVSLTGCPRNIVEVDEIKPSLTTAPKTVNVEMANKENALHVEQGAMKIEKGVELNVAPKAVDVNMPLSATVHPNAVNLEVKPNAVNAPVTLSVAPNAVVLNVPEKAVAVNLTLTVAEGAVVVKGAEKGAIETRIETPWWATLAIAASIFFGICYAVTKARKHTSRSRGISPASEKSIWDIPF